MRARRGLVALSALLLGACTGSPGSTATPAPTTAAPTIALPASAPPSFDADHFAPPSVGRSTLLAMFDYDRNAPLDIQVLGSRTRGGAKVQSIRYAVAGGAPIDAEIVTPATDSGRHPGVVLAHGGAIDPDAFLTEAVTLAIRHGMVSVLPDIPMTIDGDADTDVAYVVRSVIAERRAVDLLVARPDVDPHRLGFVGHSWGADLAAIMAGVDPRLSTVVIACARGRVAADMYQMGTPADAPAYMATTSSLDATRFVAVPRTRAVLYQWGTQDDSIPTAERTELVKATAGQVTRHDYDYGHDLINFPPATADRVAFLAAALR